MHTQGVDSRGKTPTPPPPPQSLPTCSRAPFGWSSMSPTAVASASRLGSSMPATRFRGLPSTSLVDSKRRYSCGGGRGKSSAARRSLLAHAICCYGEYEPPVSELWVCAVCVSIVDTNQIRRIAPVPALFPGSHPKQRDTETRSQESLPSRQGPRHTGRNSGHTKGENGGCVIQDRRQTKDKERPTPPRFSPCRRMCWPAARAARRCRHLRAVPAARLGSDQQPPSALPLLPFPRAP